MKRLFALVLVACGDDTVSCPLPLYEQSFELALTDTDWNADTYRIGVSYEAHGEYVYECEVTVPFLQGDAGVSEDGWLPPWGVQPCVALARPSHVLGEPPALHVGRALTIVFPNTPESFLLTVDSRRGHLVEQEIRPAYVEEYPYGRACGGPRTAVVQLELP